jgi:GMP synthase-like glutamine amidotransferase
MDKKKEVPKRSINILISDGDNTKYIALLKKYYTIKRLHTFSEYLNRSKDTARNITYHLIVFTGGEDVNPEYYGEKNGSFTVTNPKRDNIEIDIFHSFNGSGVKMLGICRGAQLLTVLSGGMLIQHCEGHDKPHKISTKLKSNIIADFDMTSTHHQMMFPYKMNTSDWKMVAWSTHFNSRTYLNGEDKEVVLPQKFLEPEIVYYPRQRALCIQGHPESNKCCDETVDYIGRLLKYYLV